MFRVRFLDSSCIYVLAIGLGVITSLARHLQGNAHTPDSRYSEYCRSTEAQDLSDTYKELQKSPLNGGDVSCSFSTESTRPGEEDWPDPLHLMDGHWTPDGSRIVVTDASGQLHIYGTGSSSSFDRCSQLQTIRTLLT